MSGGAISLTECGLKPRDWDILRKVRATNGGGYDGERLSQAALNRLFKCGAIRWKPRNAMHGPEATQAHVLSQLWHVIHGPNADALLALKDAAQ